jgi:hypothetical protein
MRDKSVQTLCDLNKLIFSVAPLPLEVNQVMQSFSWLVEPWLFRLFKTNKN